VKDELWVLINTWWFEKLYETWLIMFINLKLELYRNFCIASLPFALFCVCFLYSVMIVLIYTGAYEVAGDRAPQWVPRGTNVFILNVLFVIFCVYIKIPKKSNIFWDTILNNSIYSYVKLDIACFVFILLYMNKI